MLEIIPVSLNDELMENGICRRANKKLLTIPSCVNTAVSEDERQNVPSLPINYIPKRFLFQYDECQILQSQVPKGGFQRGLSHVMLPKRCL